MHPNPTAPPPPAAREEALFTLALAKAAAARAAFLDRECAGDPVLRARLDALLAAHAQPAPKLDRLEAAVQPTVSAPTRAPDDGVGQTIGRYKLLEKLGEGGWGTVYVAEQTEPVRRRVALKVIKLGMDTRAVVARFEAERQALAMMDHPNIARVLDAGATDADEAQSSKPKAQKAANAESEISSRQSEIPRGRPYFVMELVRGIPITRYCDENKLDTKARLDLFIKVCQAIQHAHQKGIIHRDIKPSNILVTLHDGVPVPKVIDFGIAKATEGRLTDATLFTAFEQFIGTPAYMSPEQAELSGLDIDTRSDIYSLGVLLYELLTGKTPFDAKELLASGLEAMRRTIREVEPLRPSTRLTQEWQRLGSARVPRAEAGVAPDSRSSNSSPRQGSQSDEGLGGTPQPARGTRALPEHLRTLINALKGDLDWIVMKCLEKDRSRRYDTANGLAMDLRRHLDHEPVVARPPSAAYKLQKAWRRHKLAYSAGIAVTTALAIAAAVAAWQAAKAIQAQRQTEQARISEHEQRLAAQDSQREAESERQRAVQNEQAVREGLYAAQMSQALDAWFEGDMLRARDLLDRQRPLNGQKDLRGFEWRLLWQRCQPSAQPRIVGLADSWVVTTTFTPDGKTLLVHEAGGVRLYDFPSRLEVARVEGVWAQASRNSGFVAVATTNHSVVLWNVSERREIASCPRREDWPEPFFLSQSGEKLAFLTTGGIVKIWNVSSDTPSTELHLGSGQANGLTFSSDETGIAFNTAEQIQVREIGGKGPLMSVTLAQGELEMQPARCLDQEFRLCAYGLRDNTIGVWEVTTGKRVATLRGHSGRIQEIQFSPDGKRLVSISSDGTAILWDCADWAEVTTFKGHLSSLYSLAFSPDGRFLATGGNDQVIKLWNLGDRAYVATFRGHTADVLSLAFSPDGQTLASRAHDGSIRFWDVREPKDDSLLGKHGAWVRSVAISSTGLLASGSMDGSIKLWDTTTRSEIATIREGRGAMVCNLAFSPDGHTLASTHADGQVRLWSVAARRQIEVLPVRGHGQWISKVSFSPDGQTIAFGDSENNLVLWHLAAHRAIVTIRGFTEPVRATAISPDGKIVAAGGMSGTLTFWDLATTNLLSRHDAHTGQYGVMDLNFSPDGKLLATAGWDRLVNLWDVSPTAYKATFEGHRGVVDTAAFSPDGRALVTASADSTVRLWRVDMQREVGTLLGHTSPATTVAFSPDGTLLATAGGDTTIRLWRAPAAEEIAAAEAKEKAEGKQP